MPSSHRKTEDKGLPKPGAKSCTRLSQINVQIWRECSPRKGNFSGEKKYSQINKSVSGALLLCQIVGVGRGQQRESIGYECSIPNSQHPASNTQYPILLWPNRCHGYSSNWSPVFSAQI